MNKDQCIRYYFKILRETRDPNIAKLKILLDLNTRVSERTKAPLTEAEKREILDGLDDLYYSQQIIHKSVPGIENHRSVNEADNSGILDVISALKRGVK